MMNVVIFGAGGLGREIYDTLLSINSYTPRFNVLGYIDDAVQAGSIINGIPILGNSSALEKIKDEVGIILGMAAPEIRKNLHLKYRENYKFPNIIHPTATVSTFSELGDAVLIQANCMIAANAKIGNGVMMNAHSGVGHDAHVEDYCSIMSYCDLAGNVFLGEMSFVGTGAKVIPSTVVAAGSYLCAGAVVFKDVVVKSKLLGNPAKIIG